MQNFVAIGLGLAGKLSYSEGDNLIGGTAPFEQADADKYWISGSNLHFFLQLAQQAGFHCLAAFNPTAGQAPALGIAVFDQQHLPCRIGDDSKHTKPLRTRNAPHHLPGEMRHAPAPGAKPVEDDLVVEHARTHMICCQ